MSYLRNIAPLLIAGCLGWQSHCSAEDYNLQHLEADNPFLPFKPPEPPPPPKPFPLEFRGLSVERGVRYFSFYNQETKKSFWLRDRQVVDGFRIRSYEAGHEVVLVDNAGALINLAMKETRIHTAGVNPPGSSPSNTMLAFSPISASKAEVATAVSESESHRMEQVSEQVRLRRAQRVTPSSGKT